MPDNRWYGSERGGDSIEIAYFNAGCVEIVLCRNGLRMFTSMPSESDLLMRLTTACHIWMPYASASMLEISRISIGAESPAEFTRRMQQLP